MSYQIKPLGIGGILDQAIKILKKRFFLLIGIMAVTYLPIAALFTFLMLGAGMAGPGANPNAVQFHPETQGPFIVAIIIVAFVMVFLILPLSTAATIHAVAREYLGESVTIMGSLRKGLPLCLALIGVSIIYNLAVFGGMLLFILPGIFFLLNGFLCIHVLVIENIRGYAAFRRSGELIKYDRWTNYVQMMLLGIIVLLIQWGITGITALVPEPNTQAIVQMLIGSVNTAFAATVWVVFYFSCRCKADNFDLMRLAEQLDVTEEAPADDRMVLED